MLTEIKKASDKVYNQAAQIINSGGIISFPTETVYGIGCGVFFEDAVNNLYKIKQRAATSPLSVLVSSYAQIEQLAYIDATAKILIGKFFPSPLTLVLKSKNNVPSAVTAGTGTVAVRMPQNAVALALIGKCGTPLAAPSANISNRLSAVTAEQVYQDFAGKIPLIIDGGSCEFGVESTILDISAGVATILRQGALAQSQIEALIGQVKTAAKKPLNNSIFSANNPKVIKNEYSKRKSAVIFADTTSEFDGLNAKMLPSHKDFYTQLRQAQTQYEVIFIQKTNENHMLNAIINKIAYDLEENL